MGLGGISFGSLLLILLIVLILFGTKRLRDMGEDLGHALRNFRRGLQDPLNNQDTSTELLDTQKNSAAKANSKATSSTSDTTSDTTSSKLNSNVDTNTTP